MRGAAFARSRGWAVSALALGACQSIIGISGYEINPGLDAAGGTGERTSGGEGGAGEPPSGSAGGTPKAEDGGAGGTPKAEDGGAGGTRSPDLECNEDVECDDTIDCTSDTCDDTGTCRHAPDDSQCFPDPGECHTCRLGIGCLATPANVKELLLNPSFDAPTSDWSERSDNYERVIFEEGGAKSGTRVARFGPAPASATKQEYADLYQTLTIPEDAMTLTLTGYYKLAPGTEAPEADYVAAALYAIGGREPLSVFHDWSGSSGAEPEWKSFSEDASHEEVLALRGRELTFDLLAYTMGSVYRFDSLSLQATVCE